MSSPVLPLVPEEITPEWLGGVLGHKIKALEQTDAIFATTSKIFYTVTYEDAAAAEAANIPTTIVVKGGFNPAITQAYPLLISIYQREVNFFNKIAPKLVHMELPRVLWGDVNEKQGVFVMENLATRGFTFGDVLEPWTVDQVLLGVEQLAACHAGTWGMSASDAAWMTPHYEKAVLDMIEACHYAEFVKIPDRPQLPPYLQDKDNVVKTLKKHYGSRNPRFRCLIHADPHAANTYLTPEKGEPRFLDWQMMDIGSCFHDVAYFVIGSLSTEDRRANEMRVLDHYLEALAKFGGPKFDRENDPELMIEYRKSSLAGFAWCITTAEMHPLPRLHAMIPRYISGFEDHKVFELIDSLPDL